MVIFITQNNLLPVYNELIIHITFSCAFIQHSMVTASDKYIVNFKCGIRNTPVWLAKHLSSIGSFTMCVAISSELFPHRNLLQICFDIWLHLTSRTSCDVKQWSLTYCVFVESEGSWSHFCYTIPGKTQASCFKKILIAILITSLSHLIPTLLEFEAIT